MAVFQRMFFPDSTFHSEGGEPVPTPLPEGPRNCGQLESAANAAIAIRTSKPVFIKPSVQRSFWPEYLLRSGTSQFGGVLVLAEEEGFEPPNEFPR